MASDTIIRTKKHTLIASDRVEGTAVRRPKGDKIGSVERLMIDKVSGKVAYAVLSFGGFLGIGRPGGCRVARFSFGTAGTAESRHFFAGAARETDSEQQDKCPLDGDQGIAAA